MNVRGRVGGMARFAALSALLLLVAALAAGCAASGDGSASVYVKDAPAATFDEVHIVFTKVEVHAAGGDDDAEPEDAVAGNASADGNATADGNGTSAGWKVLFSDSAGVDVDLLNASGARAAFLGEASLGAGRYTQLRVTVKSAYGVENGTKVPLTVSSGTLKLNHPFTVKAGAETRLVLDVDLDRSLHQQGNGSWRMTPVIGSVDAEQVGDGASGFEADQPGDVGELE
jgi:hypothetical protein